MTEPQIHLARSSEKLGVFSQTEVAEGLRIGRFLPTDQAWREGMAAWVPLSQWEEFRAVAPVPSAAEAASGAPAAGPSQVPWEQGKGVGSFFATVKAALLRPRETFANARLELSDWLIFAYVANLVILPARLLQDFVYEDINVQLLRFFEGMNNPALEPFLVGLRQNANAVGTPTHTFIKVGSLFGYMLMGPLLVALFGCIAWVGLWILRQKVDCGRCVAATLMATTVGGILLAPVVLLGFSAPLLLGLYCLLSIPYLVVYSRAHGAGIQRSPWVSFGAHALMYFLCVCCAATAIGLFGVAAFAARPQ